MLLSKPFELPKQDNESFCRPRPTETTSEKITNKILSGFSDTGKTDPFSWIDKLILLGCISGFILLVLLYYFIKDPRLLGPFFLSLLKILWYLLIYSAIVTVIVLFVRFIKEVLIPIIKVTIAYFNLTMNPLLNPKVSSLSCYFTDYVNVLIYYPAMIFYLICFIGLLLFDFLILLPVLAIFGFVIGTLFSLLGENRNTIGKVFGKVADMAKGTPKTSTPSSTGLMGAAASLAGAAKGMGSLTSLAGASELLKGEKGSGAGIGNLATMATGLLKKT